jgi:hypothetical protein
LSRYTSGETDSGDLTVEAKYPYLVARRAHLYRAIEAVCLQDARFAEDDVNSIYFDTPTRMLLSQKESSDYLKTKIRLRWYGRSARSEGETGIRAFLERKSKKGTVRCKPRIEVQVPEVMLREGSEDMEGVARAVAEPLRELAPDLGFLFPMIVIRYRRARFVEPFSAARISLDGAIRFSAVNGRFFPATAARMLTHGVLEVKNADGQLPSTLLAAPLFSVRARLLLEI